MQDNLLENLINETEQQLSEFAQSDEFTSVLATSFETEDAEKIANLQQVLSTGAFFDPIEIETLPGSELGALGAYASENSTIYLDQDLLASSPDLVSSVLLEETGHAIDDFLNETDASGDEGAMFASLVQGEELSNQELASLRQEDDSATLNIDNESVAVEQAELTVTTNSDFLVDDNELTLREAIQQANENSAEDTITFDSSLAGSTIELLNGSLNITSNLTIQGLGENELTVDAAGNSRVFLIDDGNDENLINASISAMTLSGGVASNSVGSDIFNDSGGGGIFNRENLTLANSTVSGNFADLRGGGIFSGYDSNLKLLNSTVSGNSANDGGGIFSSEGNTTTIIDSAILSNSTTDDSDDLGSIVQDDNSTVTLISSTVSNNSGGGISNAFFDSSTTTILNTTISGNSANGIFNGRESTTTVINSTISGNSGNGIDNGENERTLTLSNNIIANNSYYDLVTNGNEEITGPNLIENTTLSGGAIINQDPNLSSLENNGGSTLTQIPQGDSPAIDAGINAAIPADTFDLDGDGDTEEQIPFDQRGEGFDRVVNGTVDLGAVEVQDNTNSDPEVANPIADQSITEEVTFDFQIPEDTFIDPDLDSLEYSLVSAPEWISFDPSTRTIVGTPGEDDGMTTSDIDVSATDPSGASAVDNFELKVKDDYREEGTIDNLESENVEGPDDGDYQEHEVRLEHLGGSITGTDQPIWVVAHGWNSSSDANRIAHLADTLASQGKQVATIDWQTAADNNIPGNAAKWVSDVADFTASNLVNDWGFSPEQINLVGHSLGSYVSSEVGDWIQDNTQSNGINKLVGLDPARSAGDLVGYDLDHEPGTQQPSPFRSIADFSRSFWGTDISGLGSRQMAQSADESFRVQFETGNPTGNHSQIINVYSEIIGETGAINDRFQLDDSISKSSWDNNVYTVGTAYRQAGVSGDEGFLQGIEKNTGTSVSLEDLKYEPLVASSIAEVGHVKNLTDTPQTINLNQNFNDPVVFAKPISANGGDPANMRLSDVSGNSFTIEVQETENEDGNHIGENFSYLVVESGQWELPNGSFLEVGTKSTEQLTSQGWEQINFDLPFDNQPVIATQTQTKNGGQFVTTRQRDADGNGFELAMQEEEALNGGNHLTESVGWMAISSDQGGNWSNNKFYAGNTGKTVDDNWNSTSFSNTNFNEAPNLIASLSSYHGPDTAWTRHQNLNADSVEFRSTEERSGDSETGHTNEQVDYLAVGGNGVLEGTKVQKIAEFGRINQIDNRTKTVSFEQSYDDPVVIAQPLSKNGGDPAAIRIENVSSDQMSLQVQETNNQDGFHVSESVSYFVVEQGEWQLPNGSLLEANTLSTNNLTSDGFESVQFSSEFQERPESSDVLERPIIMSQLQSKNGADFAVTRQHHPTRNGVDLAMQEEEARNDGGHVQEQLGWVAMSQGSGSWDGHAYEAGHSTVDGSMNQINFAQDFSSTPGLMGSIATFKGDNPVTGRWQNLTSNGVQVEAQEDTSFNLETWHVDEDFDYLAMEGTGILRGSPASSTQTITNTTGTTSNLATTDSLNSDPLGQDLQPSGLENTEPLLG